jgi:hypothetical protein
MIKLFELLTRRADMNREAAMHYWTDIHAALVKQRMAGSEIVRRYVNNVGLADQPGRNLAPFDGAVGAWLRVTPDQFARQIAVEGNPIVADEPNFLACRPAAMLVEERVILTPRQDESAKLILFLRRHPGLLQASFERELLAHYPDAGRKLFGDGLAGLVLSLARPARWGAWGEEWPLYDAVVELWIGTDANAAVLAAEADPLLARIAPSPASLLVREVVQIDRPLD